MTNNGQSVRKKGHVAGIFSAGMVRMIGMALTMGLNFGLMWWLGAENYGVYMFGLSAGLLGSVIGRLGIERVGIRLIVPALEGKDYDTLKGIIAWLFGVALLLTALVWVVLHVTAGFSDTYGDVLRISGSIALAVSVLMGCQGILRSSGSTSIAIAPEFVLRPFFIIALIGVYAIFDPEQLRQPHDLLRLYFSGTALACGISLFLVLRSLPLVKLHEARMRIHGLEWIRMALPIFWSNMMLLSQPQLIVLIAGLLIAPAQVGWIAFAVRIATAVSIPLSVISLYAAPKIVRRYRAENLQGLQDDLTVYCRISALAGVFAAITLAILLFLGAVSLVDQSFVGSEGLVMIFVIGQLLTAITGPVGALLAMTNFERDGAVISTISLLLLLGLSVVAGSLFGMYGIAFASMIAVGFRSFANFGVARHKLDVWALPLGRSRA